MEYRRFGNTIVARIDQGEDVLEKMKRIANDLKKAHVADKSDEALLALICAHKEYMDAAMEAVKGKYGSLDAYLTEALDLTPEKRQLLAEKYLF